MSLSSLQKSLDYTFEDAALLKEALMHSSSANKKGNHGNKLNNERLEFLGDRVLNFCIADILYKAFPEEDEGLLSKRHAALVRQDTLAAIAVLLNLGPHLSMGPGEENSGGREKPSILSDAVEALVAAIYLDGGMNAAQKLVSRLWEPTVATMGSEALKDPKSRLQEWLQGRGEPLPDYRVTTTDGKAHNRRFTVEVVTGRGNATGEGGSKRQAQQAAALAMLKTLEHKNS